MDIGIKTEMFLLAVERLKASGLTFEPVRDAEVARRRLAALKKHPPMPPHSIDENDFLRTKVIWVFFKDEAGNDIGVGASRLEELGSEDLMDYWRRVAGRYFPGEGYGVPPIGISGSVIHLGDVYIKQGWREPNGHTRAVIFILYLLSVLEWKEAEQIYAFVSEKYHMHGKICEYAAAGSVMAPNIWEATLEHPIYLLLMSLGDLERVSRDFVRYPQIFDSYKEYIPQPVGGAAITKGDERTIELLPLLPTSPAEQPLQSEQI